VTEHEALIKDLASGDPARARSAMTKHIAWGLERNLTGRTAKRRSTGASGGRKRSHAA
jgi:DNA-binding GntR family transcriptional regulator